MLRLAATRAGAGWEAAVRSPWLPGTTQEESPPVAVEREREAVAEPASASGSKKRARAGTDATPEQLPDSRRI